MFSNYFHLLYNKEKGEGDGEFKVKQSLLLLLSFLLSASKQPKLEEGKIRCRIFSGKLAQRLKVE